MKNVKLYAGLLGIAATVTLATGCTQSKTSQEDHLDCEHAIVTYCDGSVIIYRECDGYDIDYENGWFTISSDTNHSSFVKAYHTFSADVYPGKEAETKEEKAIDEGAKIYKK